MFIELEVRMLSQVVRKTRNKWGLARKWIEVRHALYGNEM